MLRLLVAGLSVLALYAAPPPRTFGKGVPNFPVTASEERELAIFTLSEGVAMGSITHFWSTACGGNTPAWDGPDAGSTIYRFYVDGESTASIEAQPRMMTGFGFWPAQHLRPRRGSAWPGSERACLAHAAHDGRAWRGLYHRMPSAGRARIPALALDGTADLIKALVAADLNTTCRLMRSPGGRRISHRMSGPATTATTADAGQPRAAGPLCDGKHPLVHRLCQCSDALSDGAATAAAAATAA